MPLLHTTVPIAHNTSQSDTGNQGGFLDPLAMCYWDSYQLSVDRRGLPPPTVQVFGHNNNRYSIGHRGQ